MKCGRMREGKRGKRRSGFVWGYVKFEMPYKILSKEFESVQNI